MVSFLSSTSTDCLSLGFAYYRSTTCNQCNLTKTYQLKIKKIRFNKIDFKITFEIVKYEDSFHQMINSILKKIFFRMSQNVPKNDLAVYYVTASGQEEARKIAGALVEAKLAACANVVEGVKSIYFWEGKVNEDKEALLIIKSRSCLLPKIQAKVKELHSYKVPEVIAMLQEAMNEYLSDHHFIQKMANLDRQLAHYKLSIDSINLLTRQVVRIQKEDESHKLALQMAALQQNVKKQLTLLHNKLKERSWPTNMTMQRPTSKGGSSVNGELVPMGQALNSRSFSVKKMGKVSSLYQNSIVCRYTVELERRNEQFWYKGSETVQ